MKKYISILLSIITCITFASCESGAYYALDEKPQIKVDTSLLGLWKINKYNYFLVQNFDDVYKNLPLKLKKDSNYLLEEKNKAYT